MILSYFFAFDQPAQALSSTSQKSRSVKNHKCTFNWLSCLVRPAEDDSW